MKSILSLLLLLSSTLSADCWCNDPITGRGEPLSLLYPQTDCYRFEVEGGYLYFQALSDGFDYFYTYLDNRTPSGTAFESDASVESAHFSWKGSPRVSLAFSGTDWDSKVTWTHYKDHDSKSFEQIDIQPDTGIGAISRRVDLIWLVESLKNGVNPNLKNATEAQAFAKVKYNTIDWVAGTSFAFNEHYYLRPYFGFRAAWIQQNLTVNAADTETTVADDPISVRTRFSNFFRALGMTFGGENQFNVTDWLSFYADGALSLLVGEFKIHQDQSVRYYDVPAIPVNSNSTLARNALRPALKAGLGVNLSSPIHWCEKPLNVILSLSAGYEVNYWPLQTQWYRFLGVSRQFKHPGDFILHGAVIQGAIVY